MEVHQLRYVVAIARTGSFSRAAGDCHVSQPSLSQQVRKLEEELGERLFERNRQATRLTVSGERFVSRAARILDELAEAEREARETHAVTRGQIAIGVLPTIAPYLLPPLLESFTGQFPNVQILIHEDTTAALYALTASYEVDLAIASLPLRDPAFEVVPLFSEELLLAVPPNHPLAKKKTIIPADLETSTFLLMKEGHCLGDQTLQFCHKSGVQPRVISRSSQVETIRRLVRAGLGISLVPKMAADQPTADQPVYRSLRAPRPTRTIVAFWNRRRPLTRAALAFLETLQAFSQNQPKP